MLFIEYWIFYSLEQSWQPNQLLSFKSPEYLKKNSRNDASNGVTCATLLPDVKQFQLNGWKSRFYKQTKAFIKKTKKPLIFFLSFFWLAKFTLNKFIIMVANLYEKFYVTLNELVHIISLLDRLKTQNAHHTKKQNCLYSISL